MRGQLNKTIYGWNQHLYPVLYFISWLMVGAGIASLVYRYGFYLSEEEIRGVERNVDGIFAIFTTIYTLRVVTSLHWKAYLRSTWLEGLVNSIVLFHGVARYVGGVNILRYLQESSAMTDLAYQHYISVYLLIFILIEVAKGSTLIARLDIKPATTFIFSFVVLILLGTFLLMLPTATITQHSMPLLDALFTAVSASCVTGLAVVDTGQFFTFKGQLVILFLAQVGGIGIVSFATFFATFLSKGVNLKHQSIIQDFLSSEDLSSATSLLRRVIFLTLLIEFIGGVAIFLSWSEELQFNSLSDKIFYSVFHSISAFCNAGFSLFSDSLNTYMYSDETTAFIQEGMLIDIRRMYGFHLVIAVLIIFGSMGFTTIEDVLSPSRLKLRLKQPWKGWKIGTRMTIVSTVLLLILGTIAVMLLEIEQLRQDKSITEALITAFFQSVTTRTAGFNTMDFGSMKQSTIIVMMFLMFIGAAPGSTGGGIKCTTFYVLVLSAIGDIRGQKNIVINRRTISPMVVRKAYSLLVFSMTYNVMAIFLLTITEEGNANIGILELAFEQISAFGTAGISMGITGDLSSWGKVIIILSMYIGRVGTLTLALALSSRVYTNSFQYPEEHVMVG
ncbi:TrkH family potassium uptake protein [Algivirga pacifica]|uniref:TrkH family potassium uptake protein n=1 Tax=Algivirga pacifica TaxID=1162670 RepID=A0ABP9DEG9_9BACT